MKKFIVCVSLILLTVSCVPQNGVTFQSAFPVTHNAPKAITITGLFAKPKGAGPFPAIVLLHSCGGVRPHVSEDWPNYLNSIGYAVLTVDSFGSRGAGRCPQALPVAADMEFDAYGALAYLAQRPDIDSGRIGVMGFSLGAQVLESFAPNAAALKGGEKFSAGIAFYGTCEIFDPPKFPVLAILGDKDSNAFSCRRRNVDNFSVNIIPGAHHGFDIEQIQTMIVVSGNHRAVYDAVATNRARGLTKEFFAKNLK